MVKLSSSLNPSKKRGRPSKADVEAKRIADKEAKVKAIEMEENARIGENTRRQAQRQREVNRPSSDTVSINSGILEQDLGGFNSSASADLNYALGIDVGETTMFGPEYLGNLGYKLADDTSSDQLTLLKQIYNVSTREELIRKLQERLGLKNKTVHPLLKYRQSSFMDVQQNHYDCGIDRYVFPLQGNIKSTL